MDVVINWALQGPIMWLMPIAIAVGAVALSGYLLSSFTKSVDTARGRSNCHFCGSSLAVDDTGVGYGVRCQLCERSQPWSHSR